MKLLQYLLLQIFSVGKNKREAFCHYVPLFSYFLNLVDIEVEIGNKLYFEPWTTDKCSFLTYRKFIISLLNVHL